MSPSAKQVGDGGAVAEQLVPVGAGDGGSLAEVFGVERFVPHGAVERFAQDREHVVDWALVELRERRVHG